MSFSGWEVALFHKTLKRLGFLHLNAPPHPLHSSGWVAEILSVPTHEKQRVNLLGYLKSQTPRQYKSYLLTRLFLLHESPRPGSLQAGLCPAINPLHGEVRKKLSTSNRFGCQSIRSGEFSQKLFLSNLY